MIFRSTERLSYLNADNVISMRCPACRQQGTFEPLAVGDVLVDGLVLLGQRRCPNPPCRAHVFFGKSMPRNEMLATYPAERIDFDSSKIPDPIVTALEEAITCEANRCFVAAALMVRKTLEELCRERGAEGPNLKDRIKALGSKVVLPKELLDGLDDLRLLGNDAAHIESQEYDKVGSEEVGVGIQFTKEVLKAVYQYAGLLEKLKGLKAPKRTP